MDVWYQIPSDTNGMKIHAGRNPWRSMVSLSTQRRASSGCYPGWSWKPQCTGAHGQGERFRRFYFSMFHKPAHQTAALLLPSRNNVPILSQVLVTFLFTQTSSPLYLDEFGQAGNDGFIGARIQAQQQLITFTNSASLQLLKPCTPGASELPGKLRKRSKKNNSIKSMNPTSYCIPVTGVEHTYGNLKQKPS